MSIFLLSLSFVMVFVPGMLDPFSGGAQPETPGANRVADDLTQQRLGSAGEPYVLDSECTVELFTSGAPARCGFDGATLGERVGISDRTLINVTVRGDLDDDGRNRILCWNAGSPGTLAETGSGSCGSASDTVLSAGSKPSGSGGKTVSAQRVALLDGRDVTFEVVLW